MSRDLSRPLAAEALGTGLLVATVGHHGREARGRKHGHFLARQYHTGAILVVLITILGPVSGAHFNPAVSLVMAMRGDLSWRAHYYRLARRTCGPGRVVAFSGLTPRYLTSIS